MLEKAENKQQQMDKIKAGRAQAYFYPDYQITVTANSQAEADEQIAKIITKNN